MDQKISTNQTIDQPLLQVTKLKKHFSVKEGLFKRNQQTLKAVDGIDLSIDPGETLGIVGESGSGKTTLAHLMMNLLEPTAGEVRFSGTSFTKLRRKKLRNLRKHIQMIFQDPFSSLNPRLKVFDIIAEPLITHKNLTRQQLVKEIYYLLELVGLDHSYASRYPHEFSGGERQRIGIARAIALRPKLIICDEPISALDVSVQSQVLNLLKKLQRDLDLTYVFIGHDLPAVQFISDRIAVMYLGKIVELAKADELFKQPLHPYTAGLKASVPIAHPAERGKREQFLLEGDPPSPVHPPSGCHFHPRCPLATEKCQIDRPALKEVREGHSVACHYPLFSN